MYRVQLFLGQPYYLLYRINKCNVILKSQQYRYIAEISIILLPQLCTVSYNLINRIRQELDGITEWFVR